MRLAPSLLGLLLPLHALAAEPWPTREFVVFDVEHSIFNGQFDSPPLAVGDLRLDGRQVHVTLPTNHIPAMDIAAPNALGDVTAFASQALGKLEDDGWSFPHIDPLVHTPDGRVRWGLLWSTRGFDTSFRYLSPDGLAPSDWQYVEGNGAERQASLDAAYQTQPLRVRLALGYPVIHEVVHAIQAVTGHGKAQTPALFLSEGGAEAVAMLLTERLEPTFPKELKTAWLMRDIERPLQRYVDGDNLHYLAGSFYRYLAEADTDRGRQGTDDGLQILRPLVHFDPADVASADAAYALIASTIREHSGDRAPGLVFAEYLTEYASYGGSRYGDADARVSIDLEAWQDQVSPHPVALTVTADAASASAPLTIEPMAGRRLEITWRGLPRQGSLQLTIKGDSVEALDQIHVGEASRTDADGAHSCYETTRALAHRLHDPAPYKCMLRRTLLEGAEPSLELTLDKVPSGTGKTVLVVTNAAADLTGTEPVELTVSAAVTRLNAPTAAMTPPEPATPNHLGADVTHGMARMASRVATHSFGPEHVLFEGLPLSIEGEGEHFFASAAAASMADGQPAGTGAMVRSDEYLVVVASGPDGTELAGRHSAILRDPEALATGNPMHMVMSVGSELDPEGACGFLTEVQITETNRTEGHVGYRLEADLFNPMKAAMGGEGCGGLKAGWVERAALDLALPRPHLLTGTPVRRVSTPMQAAYDDAFDGPTLGGIATAKSLQVDGPPDLDELRDEAPDGPWSGLPGGGPSDPSAPPPGLDPERMKHLACLLPVREGAYRALEPSAVEPTRLALQHSGCLCLVAAASASEAWDAPLDPALEEAIADDVADCPAIELPTPDDLAAYEDETLEALQAMGELSEGQGGFDELRAVGDYFGVDLSLVPGFDAAERWFEGPAEGADAPAPEACNTVEAWVWPESCEAADASAPP